MIDWVNFHFLRPTWLVALVLLIPLCWTAFLTKRSGGLWRGVCDAHLLRHLVTDGDGRSRHWPVALMVLVWTAACLAAAGPTWEQLPQPAYRSPEQRVLVLSLAPSMNAADVKPSRLDRARFELQDALDAMAGSQVGFVIFNEEPYIVSPIADDPRVVAEFLPMLETELMPGRGTRVDRAIEHASTLLKQAGATRGGIVLVTDGAGDDPEAAVRAAENAADAGHTVSVLGIGTEEGAPVPSAREFVRDAAGKVVMARLEVDALAAVADAGGGRFVKMSADDRDIESVLNLAISPLDAGAGFEAAGVKADVWKDMGIVLVWMIALVAPLAFRRGWATHIALVGAVSSLALSSTDARADVRDWMLRADQRGVEAFEAGRHDEASTLFEDPDWRAAALYRTGQYDEAATSLEASESPSAKYNLGNALARAGRLEESLAAYDRILDAQPEHADARHNRDLVAKLIEEQEQEQQESEQEQNEEQQPGEGDPPEEESDSNSSEGNSSGTDSEPEHNDADAESDASSEPGSNGEADSSEKGGSSSAQAPDTDEAEENSGNQDERQEAAASSPDSEARDEKPLGDKTGNHDESKSFSNAPTGSPASERGEEADAPGRSSMASEPLSERDQAVERWLNRVDDDPAGLLREKLRRRYAQKRYQDQLDQLQRTGGRIR
jgi:Ca-activated chloride channel family protein